MWSLRLPGLLLSFHAVVALSSLPECSECLSLWKLAGGGDGDSKVKVDLHITGTVDKNGEDCDVNKNQLTGNKLPELEQVSEFEPDLKQTGETNYKSSKQDGDTGYKSPEEVKESESESPKQDGDTGYKSPQEGDSGYKSPEESDSGYKSPEETKESESPKQDGDTGYKSLQEGDSVYKSPQETKESESESPKQDGDTGYKSPEEIKESDDKSPKQGGETGYKSPEEAKESDYKSPRQDEETGYKSRELLQFEGPTAKPDTLRAKECPSDLFDLVHGSCYKVLVANTNERKSASICKRYARQHKLPQKDVNLGIIRNAEQNDAIRALALANENVTSARNNLKNPNMNKFDQHMWIGIHRNPKDAAPADGGYPWKYSRHGAPVIYTNFDENEPNNHLKNEFCVYMYLNGHVGKWNDHLCTMKNVAVLCEYMDPEVFKNGSY